MANRNQYYSKAQPQSSQASWVDEGILRWPALLGLAVDETQAQGAYVYSFDPLPRRRPGVLGGSAGQR